MKMIDSKWVCHLCREFPFPQGTEEAMLDCFQTLSGSDAFGPFSDVIAQYAENERLPWKTVMDTASLAAQTAGVHSYRGNLLVLLGLLAPLKDHMERRGLDNRFWQEVVLDITYKVRECHAVYGIFGTFVMFWFDRFFDLTRFGFGKLQAEPIVLKEDCLVDGIQLRKGDAALNIHIPRTGTPLDTAGLEQAYQDAETFYEDLFPGEYTVFVCESYLLHSSSRSLYAKGSNLERFTSAYQIVLNRDARDYSELWRLFDCVIDSDHPESLPQDTTLRRAFVDYMQRRGRIGCGLGVYLRKKSKKAEKTS